ncbi:hypothetical protein FACS1894184_21240 [Clostridia bacterium]|nr:hypothetical protein FACS1894184_21240 [Clostridia bacterium]
MAVFLGIVVGLLVGGIISAFFIFYTVCKGIIERAKTGIPYVLGDKCYYITSREVDRNA